MRLMHALHRPARRASLVAVAALASTVAASRADAQACLGLGSLTAQPANATFTALFTDGAKALDARVGFGSSIAFGGVSAQLSDYDAIGGTGKTIAVDGGLSFVTGEKRNVSVCPIASLGHTSFPDGGQSTYNASSTDGGAGVALGARVGTTSSLALIPFASLQAVYSRVSVSGPGTDGSDTDTYGVLSGGVSFALSETLLVRPLVQIPLGLDGGNASYGIGVSFGFGKR
ncbi:MAG: hypothetical protein IT359_12505 [Gemmatimonadaceae bacterium]|nr:hypothetical protein [Gemmatimonadaceae bacterium]